MTTGWDVAPWHHEATRAGRVWLRYRPAHSSVRTGPPGVLRLMGRDTRTRVQPRPVRRRAVGGSGAPGQPDIADRGSRSLRRHTRGLLRVSPDAPVGRHAESGRPARVPAGWSGRRA